jgi:hypothetical protein
MVVVMGDIPTSKACRLCGEIKVLEKFHAQRLGLYGRNSRCISCVAALDSIRHRKARLEHPEKIRKRARNWRRANPEKLKEIKRLSYVKNAEAVKAKSDKWNSENKERRRANQQAWRDRNREMVRESRRRARAKYRATAKGHLHLSIGSTLRGALSAGTKGKRRTFAVLGYSVEDLMTHLEEQFSPGMSWENYGRYGWHVDHVIPISAFNFESPDDIDFKRAWALSNLRPLWAEDNHIKSNKLLFGPFQPSLLISHGDKIQDRGPVRTG